MQKLDSTTIDKYNSSLITVPTYLEAVASIIPSLNTAVGIPEQQFDSIKKLTVLLIRLYPDLSEGYRRFCHISVQKVIDSLWHHHHPLCEPFTDQVYHQSLLHIISSRTRAEVDILIESYNKTNPNSKKSALSQLGLKPVTSYVQFWRQLLGSGVSASSTLRFDLLMKWLLSTVGKLDLSINFEEKEEDSLSALDPVQGATANVVKDFQIFVNLVDFFQELMTEKSLHRHFEKWVDIFSIDILGHIKAHAYVSGFYKILAVVFDSARTLDYFEQLNGERNSLLKRLNIFFKVLGTKIREFRDDLLFSVLELWLSLPDVLILTNFTALNQTLQTVFTTGRNSFSLALRGLEAIERWFFKPKFPVNEIETIMNNLFPILKTYFLHSDNELSKKSTPEPSKNGLKSLVKKNVQVVNVDEDPTLKEIQLKILKLIGYFGNFVRLEEKQHQGLAIDRQFLSYAVPFQDCKPELYLAREGGKLGLFKQIFHSMLRLGCDSDICVRQLFNPLCLQAIHWFSKPSSPYGEILLQILTENLSQHEDPNLREFTAVCIGEYFAWSLKHSQSSQNSKASGILKTICAMSTHASSDFRQGSVLAFNSIYRDFREDSHLVNEFSFDLLSSFLTSLQLSKELPEDSLLVTNTKQSIGHLERIFIKKKTIFNTALRRRFKPNANAGSKHTLANVVEWLVSHGGSTAKVFREECLRLTSILAPCVRDKGSTEAYLIGVEEERGLENWISIAEGSASMGNKIQDQLNFLEASSDFYNFLFENEVLKKTVFTNPKSVFCKTLLGLNTDIEGEERFSDEQIPGLLRMFSQLKFAWELLDSESLNILWECSMELSKNHLSNHTPGLLADLVEVWTFRAPSRKMKTLCHSLFTFEPYDLMQSDDKSAALRQVQWYRAVAEGGLFTSILNQTDLEEIKDKLWASILSSLYKQTPTSTGQIWETHNLDHNSRKIIESYLVIALCSGLDHATVVDATFDATNLTHHDGTFRLTATKGQIFQKVLMDALIYCDKLFEFDALVQQKPIKDVGEFTQRMLALLKSDRKLKRRFGKTVFDKTLKNWTMISNNCDVPTTVKIFAGLLAVDANACRNSLELSSWWNGKYLMNATHLDLKQKAEVFGYASVFTSSSNSRIVDDILYKKTISKLVNDLKPEELPWTEVEAHVTHIFRRVLSVFEQLPRSFCLLNPILWMLQKVSIWAKTDTNHALFRLARESLEKAVKDLYTTDSDRLKMASELYKLITATGGKLLAETTPVWKFSLLPVVASLRQPAAEKFFLNHIYDIVAKTDIKATNIYEWNLKTFAIHLLELLVYQTTEDFIKGEKLGAAYFDSIPQNKREKQDQAQEKNKLVYKNMCRVCIAGLTATTASVSSQDTVSQSCSLNYRIACYNTLAATLLVMKAEIKFINKFLFPGVRVFENIVDANANYDFPIVIDEDRHKEGIADHRKNPNSTESSVTDALKFFRTSGNLTGSSLAPEATSYDFTTSVTVANSEYYQRIFGESKGGGKSKSGQGQSTRAKLEWSEINEHGCMVAYVEILKQMGELHRLNPECEQNWVTTLVNILTNSAHHNNVKVFIVGGIVNAPICLEPFAGKLIDPIIKLIVTDCLGSVKFNHFVQDVLITLLSWSKTAKPENVSIGGILDYMLESIKCDEVFGRKDILNHALELLQNIVKHWASDLSVMPETSISSLSDETLMLQVSLSILRGGQLPQKETNPNTLMKKFLTACTHRLKGMYYTGAKCVGVLLSQIKQNASQADTQLYIQATTKKLLVLSKGKPAVFVEIISAIQQSFPEIILHVKDAILELLQRPKIRSEIFVLLPQLFKEMLGAIALDDNEMKTLPQDCANEFLIDIVGRGVFQQFCSSEGEMYAALELLELFIDSISDYSKLLKIVDWIQCAESSSNKEIRLRYAKVLLRLYEKLQTDDAGTLDLSTKTIFLKTFVRMYGDEDSSTHAVVNQFWSTVLRDWKQSSDLLVELFDLMDQNENALHVCLGLILQRCSLSPDYSKHIFPEPLEECHFIPFELDTSWRLRHSSFQPLFAESLSTAQNFSILPRAIQSSVLSQKRSVGKFGMNVLRATLANLQFTPTQKGGNDPESLMVVDDSVAYPNFDFSMPVSNSESNTNEENNVPENPILKLRKKFYASKDSAFYATKTTEKRVDRVEAARDLERSRISGVKTVRSYRIGELPDILIHHSDLLNTLLKLTKHDQLVGHQFLVYLYSGMTKEMDRSARRKLIHKSTEVFNRVLRNSLFSADRSLASIIVEVSIFNTIPIQSGLILEVSKSTNLQKLGILKLEEELLNETAESSHSNSKRAKVQCGTNSHEEDVWLGIADMYREMDEYDVLRNIFTFAQDKSLDSERKILYGKVGNALHLEGKGHLESAVVVFDEWVHGESEGTIEYTETMKTFLEDAMMQCLTKLTDWEALYKLTGNLNTAISEDLFQNRNTVERLIPVQMKSGMQLVLRNEDEDEAANSYSQFQAFMQSSLETEEGTAHLSSGYPFDVGAWLLVQDEDEYFPQAHLLLERGNEALIRKFKIVDSLPLKTQKYIMVSLQQASVLYDFLGWRKQAQSTELTVKEVQTRQLLQNWRKGFDHKPLDLLGSDVIAAYRDRFISKIGITLESSGSQEEMLLAVQNFRVEKDLWLANLGVLHKNYAVSHFSLERLKSSGRGKLNPTEFYKAFARFLTTFHEILERGDWCKRWCNVYKKIAKIHADNDIFNIRADLFLCVLEAAPKCGEADPAFSSIMKTLNGDVSSTLDASVLRNALELIKASDVQESSCSSSLYSKLFHLLKKLSPKFPLNDEITLKMLRCLLRGCVEGSSSDMLKLSNIFSLLKKSPSLIPSFGEMMENVPSYLFLPWIDQIVTTFRSDQQLYAVFRTLIDRLVLDYPQAFQLQYPEFLNSNYQLFADAMKAIVWPSRYHADMIENICKSKTEGQLVEKLTAFQDKLRSILNSSNKIYGKTHKDYATEMLQNVHDGLAKYKKSSQNGDSQGSGIGDNLLQIVSKIQKTQDGNRKRESTQVSKLVNLNSLSPFLEEFHFFEYEPIEKPGLYSDFRRVRVEDHPHIVSFHPTVLPFASVTQPLRVTFVCNNGKRSNILAKLGDDLRQDRRIQQLFKVSNVLLQDDTSIVHRNIQIVTYSCIPITADFGVIDMVDNVMSLSEMIFDTPELKAKRTETRNFYEQWVSQKSGVNSKGLTRYKFSANKVNREQAERFFTDISSKLPENLLRGNLKRRAKNLQDFFTIRQDIIKSYGALCMVHWLLGIGDRHLENSLFSMTSGKIVGIDFGRAFGTSNSIIPIPEMVPFRLTPQLQQLMMPYSFRGLFRELCILTWKCLKDSSETLLTVADVFIQEPSMDWLKIRQRPSSNQEEDVQTPSNETWAPIEIMARKLRGHNPTHLLLEELKVQPKEIVAAYSKIAQDGRIHVEKDEVSIEEYVDVLLDLATDKNVLSRLYSGWNSWV
ncbi:DNA-dependent protein kinase catalytic subunit [Orchesella cincta]|uniref:non-specific serine/threonine protein kinase n=1 Tax=Orchesella cincta TaxID=48709 RepID=A0A1D2NEQ3_ORCCI|nr:DNA-dependent protein kinase catalytic subunit [Orchesella cincta]